jgi:hypothetical protein
MSRSPDWLDRITLVDLYPRQNDPYAPPTVAPPAGTISAPAGPAGGASIYAGNITDPGTRPIVYQRGLNFQIAVTTSPQPITNGGFQCDGMVLDVPSTAANSIFFGFGSGITTSSGIEIRPGLPVLFAPDNTREMWELQRLLEQIATILANQAGLPTLGQYKAPRVVLNGSDWYVVTTLAVTMSVMLLNVPELQ